MLHDREDREYIYAMIRDGGAGTRVVPDAGDLDCFDHLADEDDLSIPEFLRRTTEGVP